MSKETIVDPDILIAEYTLGVLNARDTARAQTLLSNDPDCVTAALQWEERFLGLVDQLEPLAPPPQLLQRVQAMLGMEITLVKRPSFWSRAPRKILGALWNGLWFWRLLAVLLLALAATYAAKPNLAVLNAPPLSQLAILQAPGQTSTPGWVLTVDEQHNVVLSPRVHIDVPFEASVELWTRSASAPQPRSLGVINANQPVTIPAERVGELSMDQLFEMTLEPKAGSPSGAPTGPILFIGRMIVLNQKLAP